MATVKVAAIHEFLVLNKPFQSADIIMNNRKITVYLKYNNYMDRWTIDLFENNKPLLMGRVLVLGIDILSRYKLNLGKIILVHVPSKITKDEPNRRNLPSRDVRLYFCWEDYVSLD